MKKVFCTLFAILLLCCAAPHEADAPLDGGDSRGGEAVQLCFDWPGWGDDR